MMSEEALSEIFSEPELDVSELTDEPDGGARERIAEDSNDPLARFNLTIQPFADNVNPEFFFRTQSHERAIEAMRRCIEEHISLGLTTAVSGTGKTLLTQVLIQQLDPRLFRPALVLAYPGMSRAALLSEIAAELEIEGLSARARTHKLTTAIQNHIIELYQHGRRLILFIDEVHFLDAQTLHLLRTLSNIEVPERKLVTVLLFGEESFEKNLKDPSLKSVLSRMFVRAHLEPLKRAEVEQYVKFRLLLAGGRPDLFARDALVAVHKLSKGVPREINRICHNVLRHAACAGDDTIRRRHVKRLRAEHSI